MIPKRLEQFSKEKLINLYIRREERIEFLEEKFDKQESVGQAFFEHKKYTIIFEEDDQ